MKPMQQEIEAFRQKLGERKFRLFIRQLRERPHGPLRFWQEQALVRFNAAGQGHMPTLPEQLLEVLDDWLPPPSRLSAADVPDWIQIDSLEGQAPVQGEGKCGPWSWYFRARGEDWSIGAAKQGLDPVDVFTNTEDTFYYEESYGEQRFDASSMALDEARYFIVRELTRLRRERESTDNT